MPPQVAGMNDLEGPGAWYKSLPIITKHWLTSSLLMTILCNLSILPTSSMIYNFTSIRNNFEIWRIFTPFLFMGSFSFQTALSFLFMYSFSRQYELGGGFNTGGGGGTADYLFMILFGAIFILISGSYVYGGVIFSMNLVYYVLYVWSKRHPYAQASIWGFPVQARYHPFALLGLTILMGNPWIPTAHGMAVGHLYYFLAHVYPTVYGKDILHTPQFLLDWFGLGIYVPPTPQVMSTGRRLDATGGGGGGGRNNNLFQAPGRVNPPGGPSSTSGSSGHNWGGGGRVLGRE